MYIYNIVIRWDNGDLEGFGASALTKNQAFERAVSKANRKAIDLNTEYKILCKEEWNDLSVDQQDEIQSHWDNQTL